MKDVRLKTDDTRSQTGVIMPSQYFGAMGSVRLSGEQRLMLAVLADAINVLQSWQGGGSSRKRRIFAEAAHWVNKPRTTHPFSFENVCEALEINSELLRSRLSILTVGLTNAGDRPFISRLRLKEATRNQHMTPHRVRALRVKRSRTGPASQSATPTATAHLAARASADEAHATVTISY